MTTIRQPRYRIEIAVPSSEPNKARGDALESLLSAFLRQQSFAVVENIRTTGTEIDILARHELSGRRIVVECKSQKGNVQSAAIDGLFTDVHIRGADEGWLVSIAPLGREALGKLEEIQKSAPGRFSHVPAQDVVLHAIRAGHLADISTVLLRSTRLSDEVALILTDRSPVFCVEHRSDDRQITLGYSVLDAKTLVPITSDAYLTLIATTLDSYSEGKWLPIDDANAPATHNLPQPVVELAAGSDWRDYRPSRPEDFIGREDAIDELIGFVEDVRLGRTRTRVFGIKAASGWGKSSLVLKSAHRLNEQNQKVFVLAVDCRAAVSSDYPHLVLAKAFSDARPKGIEFWSLPSVLPASESFLEDHSVSQALATLASSNGLVVVVFDQFEEIIHSPNRALFARLENLCYQIDAAQAPVLLGFSWRTDAMVSADNPGYNLWHKLADRRRDIQLRAFTHADAQTYIDRTERVSGVRLATKDKRFLLDTYVGLPWLLKKLAVNMILNQISGQEVQGESDPIRQLFDNDLEGLSAEDHACIRAVAESAPVPIHTLSLNFSDQIITGLIERRLLISSGGQLSLYSDIFRDYVLYKRLPRIPNTYCPYVSVPRLVQCVSLLGRVTETTYAELAKSLNIALTSADNIARDLFHMKLVRLSRAQGQILSSVDSSQTATTRIVEFLKSHIILEVLDKETASETGTEFSEVVDYAVNAYRFSSMSRATIEQYCAQILRLSGSVGLIEKSATKFWWGRPIRDLASERPRPVRVMSRADGFMGQAPPRRVYELIQSLDRGITDKVELHRLGLRNAIFAATSLEIVSVRDGQVCKEKSVTSLDEVVGIARDQEFVSFVCDLLASDGNLSGPEIGARLAEEYGFNLHPSSLGRYGNALKRWATTSVPKVAGTYS